eukprot:1159472-Pelagomonas_calceolata.AAC.4
MDALLPLEERLLGHLHALSVNAFLPRTKTYTAFLACVCGIEARFTEAEGVVRRLWAASSEFLCLCSPLFTINQSSQYKQVHLHPLLQDKQVHHNPTTPKLSTAPPASPHNFRSTKAALATKSCLAAAPAYQNGACTILHAFLATVSYLAAAPTYQNDACTAIHAPLATISCLDAAPAYQNDACAVIHAPLQTISCLDGAPAYQNDAMLALLLLALLRLALLRSMPSQHLIQNGHTPPMDLHHPMWAPLYPPQCAPVLKPLFSCRSTGKKQIHCA